MADYVEGKKVTGCTANYAVARRNMKRAPFAVATARAFTVKPAWGWLIMAGIKDIENRSISVLPPSGVCVVTFSKTYLLEEHLDIVESIESDEIFRKVPDYEELKDLCGKAVGVVNYDVLEESDSPWYYEGNIPWKVSRPRWFKKPFDVTGFVGMWKMKPADAKKAARQLHSATQVNG